MRILTIDTSGQTEFVGVVDAGHVLASTATPAGRGQSKTVLAAVDEVLADSGTELTDLDGIAVSIGPGRFSGLRVGLATAKGLAATGGRPVWAISALEALANALASGTDEGDAGVADDATDTAGEVRWIFAATDARRGEVYGALFERAGDGSLRRATDDTALPPGEAARWAVEQAGGERVLFGGTGAAAYRGDIVGAVGPSASFAAHGPEARTTLVLAELAERSGVAGAADAGALEPIYIRGAVG